MELKPHGVPGQINIFVLDKDSVITGHGAHNRLIVFRDANDPASVEVREDLIGLPMSTDKQRQHLITHTYMRPMRPRGTRLRYIRSEPGAACVWHYYKAIQIKKGKAAQVSLHP